MNRFKHIILCLCLGLSCETSLRGQSSFPAVDTSDFHSIFSSPEVVGFANNATFGWGFSATQAIIIDDLGWLIGGPSLSLNVAGQQVSVGLWSSGGTLLRSVVISSNSHSIAGSLYESIDPLVISAGDKFVIALGATNAYTFLLAPTNHLQSPFIFEGAGFTNGSGFIFPAIQPPVGNGDLVPAATFLFELVPEPTALALFAFAAAILGIHRNKGFE